MDNEEYVLVNSTWTVEDVQQYCRWGKKKAEAWLRYEAEGWSEQVSSCGMEVLAMAVKDAVREERRERQSRKLTAPMSPSLPPSGQ